NRAVRPLIRRLDRAQLRAARAGADQPPRPARPDAVLRRHGADVPTACDTAVRPADSGADPRVLPVGDRRRPARPDLAGAGRPGPTARVPGFWGAGGPAGAAAPRVAGRPRATDRADPAEVVAQVVEAVHVVPRLRDRLQFLLRVPRLGVHHVVDDMEPRAVYR